MIRRASAPLILRGRYIFLEKKVVFTKYLNCLFLFAPLIVSAGEVKEISEGLYEYIRNGESIATTIYKHDNHGNSTPPGLFANCMVVSNGFNGGDEGRHVTYQSLEIYCGRKYIKIKGSNETNIFGGLRINNANNKWAVFLPQNDGYIPHFNVLHENGDIITSNAIANFSIFGERARYTENEETIIVEGSTSIRKDGKWAVVPARITIRPDGSFSVSE